MPWKTRIPALFASKNGESRTNLAIALGIIGDALRELALARAIWLLADGDATATGATEAKRTLDEYAADARGVFAACARAVLSHR
ncbi:MAG: hypothetical protein IJK04_13015 [Kiritimatiellae bacterium]|nr:hypothetical protein [Kiritimatiellia bacterium]